LAQILDAKGFSGGLMTWFVRRNIFFAKGLDLHLEKT